MHAVVEHPDAKEHRARNETVRNHLHQRPFKPQRVEHEEAQGHEAHVRDRRVGDQFLHVGLYQGDEADVHHRDQRQRDHQRRELMRSIGNDRQREAQETVCAELEADCRQHHRTAGGRFDVGVGKPGMHRPHRHLDAEGDQEREEDQDLRLDRERKLVPVEDAEAATGLHEQVQQREQHQQRAEQRVEEELDRRVHTVGAAPDADDQVERDQRSLEEHVEQDAVERGEDAVHQARHDQERGHVLRHLVLDDLPARHHHEDRDERVEDDEKHRQAVHPEVIVDVEARHPRGELDELHRTGRGVEAGVERNRHDEASHRDREGEHARQRGIAIRAGREHQQATENRYPDRQTEERNVRHRCFPFSAPRTARSILLCGSVPACSSQPRLNQ